MFRSLVNNKENAIEYVECYTVDELNDSFYTFTDVIRKYDYRKKCNVYYYVNPSYFDIETSHNHNDDNLIGWLYQWAFYFQEKCVVGRTPSEFVKLLNHIREHADGVCIVCLVHNLSYEFQYLKNYLYECDNDITMLAIKSHQILNVKMPNYNIEFRCTYRLSNMSLDGWCRKYKTYHTKATGLIDYDVIRYQDTPLTVDDWRYMVSDVIAMSDCYKYESDGYNITNIPITSTGFVRKDMQREFAKDKKNRDDFKKTKLSPLYYQLCKRAFSGGLTHGNRLKADKIIRGNIGHFDFRSFYPSTIACCDFPMSQFMTIYDMATDTEVLTVSDCFRLARDYCLLIEIEFDGATVNRSCTLPILQISKLVEYNRHGEYKLRYVDNGRALQVDGLFTFLFTELDLETFCRQYTTKRYRILRVVGARRGKLPQWFRNMNDKYFNDKLHLKDVDPVLYAKSKAKLNAQYGMSATDPIKNETIIDWLTGEWSEQNKHKGELIDDELIKFYKKRTSFMRFQWGVWVTSHCRNLLVKMVELVGYDNFLYCDTDSIFFIKTPENAKRLEEWNKRNYEERVKRGEYIDGLDGTPYVYMAFEDENDGITAFKFLHAKCYGAETNDGLKLTIAGVPSSNKNGTVTREQELKTLDNLRDGFVFNECGGNRIAYIEHEIATENINGHLIEFASSGVILPKEYEVGKNYEEEFLGLTDGKII